MAAQFVSKRLLNVVFIMIWFWGLFSIGNVEDTDTSLFFAGLPAMMLVAGVWFTLLNKGLKSK